MKKEKCVSLQLAGEVKDICEPFFKQLGTNAFSYSKVFPDGSRAELWSDADALFHTFLGGGYLSKIYTPDNYDPNQRYILLADKIKELDKPIKESYEKQLRDQQDLFNHDHCYLIVNKLPTLTEYFIFYMAKNVSDAVNLYINSHDEMEMFIQCFKKAARHLIIQVENDKIVKPWRAIEASCPKFGTYRFSSHDWKLHQNLSPQEMGVLQHSIEGKTAKQTARAMGLSNRTVEHYLENIKNKLGCQSKSELIVLAVKKGVLNKSFVQ